MTYNIHLLSDYDDDSCDLQDFNSVTYQQDIEVFETKVDKANATLFANMTQSIVNEHKNHIKNLQSPLLFQVVHHFHIKLWVRFPLKQK